MSKKYSPKIPSKKTVSPHVQAFHVRGPQALKRQPTTRNQKNFTEDTLIWGEDDAFPLRLAKAVQSSPATTSCLSTTARFIKGSGFSNKGLMKIKVDESGTTLWQLHSQLVDMMALYSGFATNFKYNRGMEITNTYVMPYESLRFVKPEDDLVSEFHRIKYNPYFGTIEYNKKYTKEYCLFDKDALEDQIKDYGDDFLGQVYYYGKTNPVYRFYTRPEYWSAEKWIEIDGKIQEFHASNLENGFFQSVLMTVIGDPNEPSRNPAYQVFDEDENGNKIQRSTKTVGEEFNDQMNEMFSGSDKAGTVLVQWAGNTDQVQKIQPFQSTANDGLFTTLQDLTTKNITVATRVPSILANISEGVSLGSAGSEIQKAIELMQSWTGDERTILEQFYNEILLPNLAFDLNGADIVERVEIVNYNPVSEPVELEDKFWDVLTIEEKRKFIKKNISSIELIETPDAQAVPGMTPGEPQQMESVLKNLKMSEIGRIQSMIRKFNKGEVTEEQTKQFLKSFGMSDEEINTWLITEDEANGNPGLIVSK